MEYYCIMVKTGEEESFKKQATLALKDYYPETRFFFFYHMRKTNQGVFYEKPTFEGYVFMEALSLSPRLLNILKNVKGFIRILRDNTNPTRISGTVLEELQFFIRNGEHWKVTKIKFMPDQKIKVISGLFEGIEGYIYRINHKKKTITINTNLTANTHRVDILYEDAEIIDESQPSTPPVCKS